MGSRLNPYVDDESSRGDAETAQRIAGAALLASGKDRKTALEKLEKRIREARFHIGAHRELVDAAVSSGEVPSWTARLNRAGLIVDRFEPLRDGRQLIGWQLEIHKPAAGLEEAQAGQALDVLAEATTEDGVVVIGPEGLESHAGLEELVKRAPPALAQRMILFGVGAAALARVRAANPAVRAVESGEVGDLAAFLLTLPEAERVTVLGAAFLADQLRAVLPVEVTRLEWGAALRFILAAAGVYGPALDQVDIDRLEQFLARLQSA